MSRAYLTHCRAMQSHAKGPPISPDMRLRRSMSRLVPSVDMDLLHADIAECCNKTIRLLWNSTVMVLDVLWRLCLCPLCK